MKKLSILIPTYNEERHILEVLRIVNKVDLKDLKLNKEIIIIDDGSKDKTTEILKKNKKLYTKLIRLKKNRGKGFALRQGIKETTGNIILIQDADLEYNPYQYPELLKPILKGKTEVVYGSRFIEKHKPKYLTYYLGNKILSTLTTALFFRRITYMETCYKVFKSNVIKGIKLKSKRFDFEPEVTAKILKKGYEIHEVPIFYKCRDFKEGKKIKWTDGISAIWYLIKYRVID